MCIQLSSSPVDSVLRGQSYCASVLRDVADAWLWNRAVTSQSGIWDVKCDTLAVKGTDFLGVALGVIPLLKELPIPWVVFGTKNLS